MKGGTLSNFKQKNKHTYSAIFKPNPSTNWKGKIHIPSNSFKNTDGESNQDGNDRNNTVTIERIKPQQAIQSPEATKGIQIVSKKNTNPSAADTYLVLDTSTSMRDPDAKNNEKIQHFLALKSLTKSLEKAGFQAQHRRNKRQPTFEELLQEMTNKSTKQMIQTLDKYRISSNPDQKINSSNLNVHLITYDYHVQHKHIVLSHKKPEHAHNVLRKILTQELAGEQYGASIKGNSQWRKLGLPKPTRLDLYRGDPDRPSNLYAGTEMLGALEGLDFLLTKKANDPNKRDRPTTITFVLDGRPERRSWWDTRTDSASDSITGLPIPLPRTLGQEDITTSGLLYDDKGNPHYFKNNSGEWQWRNMQNDLNSALDKLADQSTNPSANVQVNLYGLDNSSNPNLETIYNDLFNNQTFDNREGNWSYSHQTIQSLQDINL